MKRTGRSARYSAVLIAAVVATVAVMVLSGCTAQGSADTGQAPETVETSPAAGGEGMKTIYLAGGCFWGVEKLMSSINGVVATEAGYANGDTDDPSYDDVVTGRTGYAETVRVDYDPEVAPLPFILEWFYQGIEPTSLNRQGNDVGTQYRTGIYYEDPEDAPVVEASLEELQKQYDEPVVVEAEPLTGFTNAEEYHQDYLEKNPGGYCHIDFELFEKAAEAEPDPSHFSD
jgi:peptide methionine sulfoxide reductase msrA/msrB